MKTYFGSFGRFGFLARKSSLGYKPVTLEFDYLVDENGNNLVDEQGNKLIAPVIQINLNMTKALNSQYIPVI